MGFIDEKVDSLIRYVNRVRGKSAQVAEAAYQVLPGLTLRGFERPDGGAHLHVDAPVEFQGMTTNVAGLYPFGIGTASPMIGSVLGRNLITNQPLMGDPVSLFLAGVITTPSAFVLGLPSRGKSSLVVRMLLGLRDIGFIPLILGDLKPDYVGMILEMKGQVIRVGLGDIGCINALDAGPIWPYLKKLSPQTRRTVEGEIHARRINTVAGLVEMVLKRELTEQKSEHTLLSAGIKAAAEEAWEQDRQPVLEDLLRVLESRHPRVRQAITAMDEDEYDAEVRDLLKAIMALGPDGRFGGMFWGETTVEMDIFKPVVFDVSSIDESQGLLRGAAQLVIWSYGQAGVLAAKTLSREPDKQDPSGERMLAPEVHHVMVMDELWQILRAWEGAVHRVNEITKINRSKGLGQILVTHTMKDLELSTVELTKIARGFVERSAMVYLGGLAANEQDDLRTVRKFSVTEIDQLDAWSAEGSINPATGQRNPPPGRGHFLLKTSAAPGVPFRVNLTRTEKIIHDTNEAWAEAMARYAA